MKEVRTKFFKLLGLVGELVGSESGPEAAPAAALVTYVHLQGYLKEREAAEEAAAPAGGGGGGAEREARQRRAAAALSATLFVPVPTDTFRELVGLVRALATWRAQPQCTSLPPVALALPDGGGGGGGALGAHVAAVFAAAHAPGWQRKLAFPFSAFGWGDREDSSDSEGGEGGEDGGGEGRGGAGSAIGAPWLFARCAAYVAETRSALTAEAVGEGVLEALKKHKGAEDAALFDLLGEDGFELVMQLCEHKEALAAVSAPEFRRAAKGLGGDAVGSMARRRAPQLGVGVSLRTQRDDEEEKEQTRAARRAKRAAKGLYGVAGVAAAAEELGGGGSGGGGGGAPLYGLGADARVARALTASAAAPAAGLLGVDEVISSMDAYGGVSHAGSPKRALPAGATDETRTFRIVNGALERVPEGEGGGKRGGGAAAGGEGKGGARWTQREVSIPPPAPPPPWDPSRLVAIASLEPFAQRAFAGIRALNRLQSELFEAAYRSKENMLVCAPTGAGKTNVAMLAVCRELMDHLAPDGVSIRDEEFKIVYVAPMKALAQEVVAKFSERLASLGLRVRELTGDVQLTRAEVADTQVVVTTPEKWDVITRKAGEGSLVGLVRLLIIDEVHLLADTRGAVIESLVARTLRMVETSQSMIRIVGLSATLPNYKDVGRFLRVNPEKGLFYFGEPYRPVPLRQTFVGIEEPNPMKAANIFNRVAYEKALAAIRRGKQVMVFVHSRKDTGKTARALLDIARAEGTDGLLSPYGGGGEGAGGEGGGGGVALSSPPPPAGGGGGPTAVAAEGRVALTSKAWVALQREVDRSRNVEMKEVFPGGIGIHHAGMLRGDRNLSERLFAAGCTKVLCCTATLAWGVNLPAHTVIIKGTEIYEPEQGGFKDLSVLDVMQIFGRAGRPQFDVAGEGVILTARDKLPHYLSMLTTSVPIESSFIKALADHLNAEIVSGTVTNVTEAVTWLSYTYLYVRMMRNPIAYGITFDESSDDPMLASKRLWLIEGAAKTLDECRMVRYDATSGQLAVTDLGRVASHYYLVCESVRIFNEALSTPHAALTDGDAIKLVCLAKEFEQVKVRDDEMGELDELRRAAPFPVEGDVAHSAGKTNVLLQAAITGISPRSFTLISDTSYITQSAGRISRALFEVCLQRGWCSLAERLLELSKSIDKRLWRSGSPLRQFNAVFGLPGDVIKKLEELGLDGAAGGWEDLLSSSASELGALVGHPALGSKLASCLGQVPRVDVEVSVHPITRGLLQLRVSLWAGFEWSARVHGATEPWHVWVEDAEQERVYHKELVLLTAKAARAGAPTVLTFVIPVFEPMPAQYWIRTLSDRWLGCGGVTEVPFRHLMLPPAPPPHTVLLDLPPLPTSALRSPARASLYPFSHFNAVQTQFFHVLYRTDRSVLLGAPTGSGKTVAAELALYRLFDEHPGRSAVYIAPLKALVAERVRDWSSRLGGLGKRVVELTGDAAPDLAALARADVIITTPEKWDVVSRGWARRAYVLRVGLVIIDEIHLLGEDRGPVLEVIVSRMRHIVAGTGSGGGDGGGSGAPTRFVGLSTALANAGDLGEWLGIERVGLYNFRPSVRPIPMDVHIAGFPGKHYCPRMQTMNKPAFRAILQYSPDKPVLIFVSSRRQTRLTALDLISLCAGEERPRRFVTGREADVEAAARRVRDDALKHTLAFGIGIHHAGLCEGDREAVEHLFAARAIQVLVSTSTLAWGVNLPAHLVVIKGTEYFDAKTLRYEDYPVTDVLQMMGRAGRPGFDTSGVALILAAEPKKTFLRKFLYEPFPVESKLLGALVEHLGAEVAAGTIASTHDAVQYLTWTYMFRRLLQNPSYYGLEGGSPEDVSVFLYRVVGNALDALAASGCVARGEQALAALAQRRDAALGAGAAGSGGGGGGSGAPGAAAASPPPTPPSFSTLLEEAAAAAAAAREKAERELPLAEDAVAPTPLGAVMCVFSVSLFRARRPPPPHPHPHPLKCRCAYYLKHKTVAALAARVEELEASGEAGGAGGPRALLSALTGVPEFAEVPVRHNEEELNEGLGELLASVGWAPPRGPHGAKPEWGSPHVKAYLLLAARMARAPLPHVDYATDTKTVVDAAGRVLGALVEVAALAGARRCVEAGARLAAGVAAGALPGAGSALAVLPCDERVRAALAALAGAGEPAAGDELRRLAAAEDGKLLAAARAGGAADGGRALLAALRAAPLVGLAVALAPPPAGAAAAAVAPGAPLSARFSLSLPPAPPEPPSRARGAAKARPHGGWLAVCRGERVLALRKCMLERRHGASTLATTVMLNFSAPLEPGAHELTALLLCDSVAGMDAAVALRVHVVAP
jgi:activating signal cointegrator complex subunit 3